MTFVDRYEFGDREHVAPRQADLRLVRTPLGPGLLLALVLRLYALGLSVIPLKAQSKEADGEWKSYQSTRAPVEQLHEWFGRDGSRNAGIVTGAVSGVVVIDTDTPEAEALCAANLPPTPMMTRTAKGFHRYYRCVSSGPWAGEEPPAFIVIGDRKIEVKRDGQYVVAPGSVHQSGHVYAEVEPWPSSLDTVPEFPFTEIARLMLNMTTHKTAEPLPDVVPDGERNHTLFREGSRLRRLDWTVTEIAKSLLVLNAERCRPPLDTREVEGIAASCAKYEPAADLFPTTETGDAEFLVVCNADTLRYDHRRARWLLFNGHWTPQTDGEVDRLVLDAMRARQAKATTITDTARRTERLKWAIRGEERKRQANCLALARSIKPVADDGEDWDADPSSLGVKNGVVDLRAGTLRAGRPEDRITLVSPLAYDTHAPTAKWEQFVLDVCDGDEELADYLRVSFGYVLTGETREQCFWIFYGLGANGKSTFLESFTRHVLPAHSWSMNFPSNTWSESMSEYQRAELVGRRLVVAKENEQAKRLNTEFIKSLTGDETIAARHPDRRPFNFRPVAKFFLAVNHKPVIRDESHGMWRRVRLVPFLRQFAVNPQFAQNLVANAQGILTWAVRGAVEYQRHGLSTPKSVLAATKEYQEESDVLATFIEERCVLGDGLKAQAQPLFEEYRWWCDARREPDADRLSQKEFGFRLDQRFTHEVIDRKKFYVGIGPREIHTEVEM